MVCWSKVKTLMGAATTLGLLIGGGALLGKGGVAMFAPGQAAGAEGPQPATGPRPAATPRVGDPGSVFDPAKYDARSPDMKQWAKAGVEGGIPAREATRVVARLKPGDDIQATIARAGKGVILLAAGTYSFPALERWSPKTTAARIALPGGAILRGEDKEKTVLEHCGVDLHNIEQAGMEDLTFSESPIPRDFHGGAAVDIRGSKNCWVQNCRFLRAEHNTIRVGDSRHVTLRDNYTERGAETDGYYFLAHGAAHVLVFNETVKAPPTKRNDRPQAERLRLSDAARWPDPLRWVSVALPTDGPLSCRRSRGAEHRRRHRTAPRQGPRLGT